MGDLEYLFSKRFVLNGNDPQDRRELERTDKKSEIHSVKEMNGSVVLHSWTAVVNEFLVFTINGKRSSQNGKPHTPSAPTKPDRSGTM